MLLSTQSQAPGFEAALGELCRIYWYPLYAYVRRRGYPPEEAQDLTTRRWHARIHGRESSDRFYSGHCKTEVGAEIHELCEALLLAEGWIVP